MPVYTLGDIDDAEFKEKNFLSQQDGRDIAGTAHQFRQSQEIWRKMTWLLLPGFRCGWDTSGWPRDPKFRR
jgi:hypothetical protein